MHKCKVGQEIAVQRGNQMTIARIVRLGEENGMPVYDTDDGHWCYEHQIISRRDIVPSTGPVHPITLTKEQGEKIAELLRGYYGALDNILYDKFSYDDLNKMLEDIDDLALVIERQM